MKTTNRTKGRQQYREINKETEKAHQSCTSREPKMEGALEAHHGGDAEKGLAVDGGQRTGTEKTGDAGPENKHKQEKMGKQQGTNKTGKKQGNEPKVDKTAQGSWTCVG
jgi:hypothetical protein